MKSKTLLIILCLSLALLSVASVSASDVDNMTIQISDNDIITSDEMSISDMEASDESDLLNSASFNDLQLLIDNAEPETEINLTKDYSMGDDWHTIKLHKNLIINGNGHTVDGNYKDRLFEITYDGYNIVFKNITFKHGNITGDGGAIYNPFSSSSVNVDGCEFYENNAWGEGGAIYSKSNTFIANSIFKSNWGQGCGGAVYCKGKTGILNSTFEDNHMYVYNSEYPHLYTKFHGGAIYSTGNCEVYSSTFKSNNAFDDGGAIYCDGETYINQSEFSDNLASGDDSYGGAIRSNGECHIESSTFKNNYAGAHGGAVYANHDLTIDGTQNEFNGNKATAKDGIRENYGGAIYCCGILKLYNATLKENSALLDGGAIYSEGAGIIEGCEFKENSATKSVHRCFGGAIRIKEPLSIAGCTFDSNSADNWGGAIYADKELFMFDCNFIGNKAKYAGAVYASTITYNKIRNCTFTNNKATSGHGGAFYLDDECALEFVSCIFEDNTCTEKGGAIYISSSSSALTVSDCTFHNNKADEYGGAIFTGIMGAKSYGTTFTNNHAGKDGGAVYINNICTCEFETCRFQNNTSIKRGGAIHIDATTTHLKIHYCTFADNDAEHGKSIYNFGEYDSFDMCWFGTNNPDFGNKFIKGYVIGSDDEYKPSDYLKIEAKLNSDEIYLGNPYKLTFNFHATNGNDLKKDILHSEVKFSGAGWNSSNLQVNNNEITFDINFVSNFAMISVLLDDQLLSLTPHVKNKVPSTVEILRCDNVTFPEKLIVEYNITGWVDYPEYIIKNNTGGVVETGICMSQGTPLTFDLPPGINYSITIINHEGWSTLESNATAYFSVKTTVAAVVTADNVTYGNNTKITLRSSHDGLYNISVGNLLLEMEVINGTCVKEVKFKVGEYQTNTTFSDDNYVFKCIEASFSVGKATPDFYLTPITSAEYIYGFAVVVGQSLMFSDATGYIVFTLNNEFYSNKTTKNDFYADDLDLGTYLIGARYSGDSNYYPANATPVKIKVVPADNNIIVSAEDVTYGENVTIVVTADYNGVYQINVSGEIYNVTVYGAGGNISLSLNAGSYWANVIFDDPHYNANITNAQFNVFKQKATITAADKSYVINYGGKYGIQLKDAEGKALTGKKIIYTLNGKKIGSAITNSKGVATIKLSPRMLKSAKAGKRNLMIELDDINYQAKKTVKITIKKEKAKIKAKSKRFKSDLKVKKYAVKLKNSKGKAIKKAKVTLKVKGKKYNACTNSRGKAIFKITKLTKRGTYKATIIYKGNKYYNKVTKKAKITVVLMVSKGSKDKETAKKIQRALKKNGFYLTAYGHYLMVDGIYNQQTVKGVKEFQKAKGLKVTGKVDEKTAKKLKII